MVGFSDSDYTGCMDDKKSIYGYIFMMVEETVSWKSVKQRFTTSSNMKPEYVACYEVTCHAIWFTYLYVSRTCHPYEIVRSLDSLF